jgi:hypothetical protein
MTFFEYKEFVDSMDIFKLKLDDFILERLGFSGYRDGAGDYGTRRLHLIDTTYEMVEYDDMDDLNDGYFEPPTYRSSYYIAGFNEKDTNQRLDFLHELYQAVLNNCSDYDCEEFVKRCKDNNMLPYIDKYNEFIKKLDKNG